MMFLTNTTPIKQARNICLVKRGYRQIEPYSCRLCYTWQFLIQLAMLFLANAVIDMDRCYFNWLQSFECGSHFTLTAATMIDA